MMVYKGFRPERSTDACGAGRRCARGDARGVSRCGAPDWVCSAEGDMRYFPSAADASVGEALPSAENHFGRATDNLMSPSARRRSPAHAPAHPAGVPTRHDPSSRPHAVW